MNARSFGISAVLEFDAERSGVTCRTAIGDTADVYS